MKHLYDEEPVYTPYSNEDKIIIYKQVLKHMLIAIEKGNAHGLCYYMTNGIAYLRAMESVDTARKGFWSEESIENSAFPELMKYKPELLVNSMGVLGGIFWFPLDSEGMKRRVEIITEILTDLRKNNGTSS